MMQPRDVPPRKPPDLATMIATFCAVYPGLFDPARLTWGMFFMLYHRIPHVLTVLRVNQTNAVTLGAGLALGNEGAKTAALEDVQKAFGR